MRSLIIALPLSLALLLPAAAGAEIPSAGVCGATANPTGLPNEQPAIEGDLSVKQPGAAEFTPVPKDQLCVVMNRFGYPNGQNSGLPPDQVSVFVSVKTGSWPYPEGSTYKISGRIEGFDAAGGAGAIDYPAMKADPSGSFEVEGRPVEVKSAGSENQCAEAPVQKMLSFSLSASMGGPARNVIAGSNGYRVMGPQMQAGQLGFDVAGCGDGDPATVDGFLNSQLSSSLLTGLGISQATLGASDDGAVASMIGVSDNGKKAKASFNKELGLDGTIAVRMVYRTSFSEHRVTIGGNKKAISFAKTCTKKKGKLRKKGQFLTCKPKKGKTSKIKL